MSFKNGKTFLSTALMSTLVATMTTGALADESCLVSGDADLSLELFQFANLSEFVKLVSTEEKDYIYLSDLWTPEEANNNIFEVDFRMNFDTLPDDCDPQQVGFVDDAGNTVYPDKVSFKVWNEYGTNKSATFNYGDATAVFPALSYGAVALDSIEILKAGRHSFAIELKDETGKRLAGQKSNVIILPTSRDSIIEFCQRPHLYLTNSGSGYSATKLGKKDTVYLNQGIVRLQQNLEIDASEQGWVQDGTTVPSETLMNVSFDPEYPRFCSGYLGPNDSDLDEVVIEVSNDGVQYPTGSDSTSSDGYFYAGDAKTADEGFRFDQRRLEKEGVAAMLYSFQATLSFADGSEESGTFDTEIETGLDSSCYAADTAAACGDEQ